MRRPRLVMVSAAVVLVAAWLLPAGVGQASTASQGSSSHMALDCTNSARACTEVLDSEAVFGEDHYVGHDEPAVLFYSNRPGSGNRLRYTLTLPKNPPSTNILNGRRTYDFMNRVTFWFGMAMCDTQSYPELLRRCTPDSDKNIVDPAKSPYHPGTAFMEMQFYPPGWVNWPAGISCSAHQWCAALTIDSLTLNPITGQENNAACEDLVTVEPVNFAFITKSGQPHAPPSPVNSTIDTFTPHRSTDLFMNSGDQIRLTMHDTAHGLLVSLHDLTTGQSGSMTASAAKGFGQVKFDPNGNGCTNIPYDFHPMYSTSSPRTRVPWAAHTYNVSFSDEIGHFDYCTKVPTPTGSCAGLEGRPGDREPTDFDDNYCLPGSMSTLIRVSGCLDSNLGFDGMSYQRNSWPDGNTSLHPTPLLFTSPLTGSAYDKNYERAGFEADLPRIEADAPQQCDRFADNHPGCTRLPLTDDGKRVDFYPYYSTTRLNGCTWMEGATVPGLTVNSFGKSLQYGDFLRVTYTGLHNTLSRRWNDLRRIFPNNPCPASTG
jgi:hypothetical protein